MVACILLLVTNSKQGSCACMVLCGCDVIECLLVEVMQVKRFVCIQRSSPVSSFVPCVLQRVPIADAIQRITGNPALRFGFLTATALTGIWAIQNWSPDGSGTTTTQVLEARQMMTGLLGFMMWKLAVVGVTTVPVQTQHALDEIV